MTEPTASRTSAALARPTLLPGLRRLWRGRHALQLGVDPARAVVLELPDPAAARLLDLLDGTRSERAVLTEASRYRIAEADARALLDALRGAGLVVGAQTLLPHTLPEPVRRRLAAEAAALALRGTEAPTTATPAQILRRRAAARVVIAGQGRLAVPVAVALAQAGVGHIAPAVGHHATSNATYAATSGSMRQLATPVADDVADDIGDDIVAAVARAAPGTRTMPVRRRETSFVVQVGTTGPANLVAAGYAQHRLAHLALAVRDGTAVVGPLVPPAGGPCLRCLDLHRRDRDPDWPELAGQLAGAGSEPCAAATVLAAAGLAAGEVLSWLDGDTPTTIGASIEVTCPGRLRRRSWPPHPHCDCYRRAPGSGRADRERGA